MTTYHTTQDPWVKMDSFIKARRADQAAKARENRADLLTFLEHLLQEVPA